MSKDHLERRAYRKSPGRQYGYEYDPLSSQYQVGQSQGGANSSVEDARSAQRLAQRPDPRRTRQLLRQNILASKLKGSGELEDELQERDTPDYAFDEGTLPPRGMVRTPHVTRRFSTGEDEEYLDEYEGRAESQSNRDRYRSPQEEDARGYAAARRAAEVERRHEPGDDWQEFDFVDPDIGYEDPLDQRVGYAETPPLARRAPETSRRSLRPVRPQPDYDDEEEEEEEEAPRRKPGERGKIRRRVLLGLGIGAVAAGGIAAYELAPRIPGALSQAGTNIEHEIQNAFNKGVAAGADAARKEFITALDSVEGVSLQAAIDSARLTRLAYDAFVSPVVTLAATITGDFLNVTLRALIAGRGWLARINQDNDTLAALQTVLQTWVQKVNEVPEQLQSITDTDLDGAQSYLRGLQHTIQQEQAKLNSSATPAPTPTHGTKPTATPTP
ncbi:MAG TPA: hypothetical protein VNE61_02520 [Ktedonobacteraceae bacterium]|nr:hypothetical protein [Ktedonobacteraceae bacterium]